MRDKTLQARLRHKQPWTRALALQEVAAATPTSQTLPWLLTALDDPDPTVRTVTEEALIPLAGWPPLRAALIERLASGQLSAVRILRYQVADPAVWRVCLQLVQDQALALPVREALSRALQPIAAQPEVFAELLVLLSTAPAAAFTTVVGALEMQLAQPQVRDALITALNNTDHFIRLTAVRALRRWIYDPTVQQALRQHLDDPAPAMRQIIDAFLSVGTPAARG